MIRNSLTLATNAYKTRLEQNPLRTKMITSACLFSLGDFLCQKTEGCIKRKKQVLSSESSNIINYENTDATLSLLTQGEWDKSRTLRQGMIGGLMLSPGLHFFLTRVMTRAHFPSLSRAANIGARVAIH